MIIDKKVLILQTKLYIPQARFDLVSRPRLMTELEDGQQRKLTLLCAPAGFGKTTLLSEWIEQAAQPVAWLSLDEGDNDPARFLTYFVTALQKFEAGIGESLLGALQSPQPPPVESVLTALINDLATTPDQVILVLDDYHVVAAQPIHEAVAFLLDYLPPQMHLIIATRADPPLPLSRLRGRGQILEIRADDLRFTVAEASHFLSNAMGLNLSPEEVAALETRTEGWIAGLQLAALSMQGRDDIADFIDTFTGSHRYVIDYLADEVLSQRPVGTKQFLLQTSILDRLSDSLCNAVAEQDDSQTILETLEAANLFIVPLDDQRRWYRYHHLFADLLRARLQRQHPNLVPELHHRAAKWYEAEGLLIAAVDHALAAGDAKQAARLIEQISRYAPLRGELATLHGWLEALPEELILVRPRLCLARAWAILASPELDLIESLLHAAEHGLETSDEAPAEIEALLSEISALRAWVAVWHYDWARVIELAHQALEQLREDDISLRGFILSNLGFAHHSAGEEAAAAVAFDEAIAIAEAARDPFLTHWAMNHLAQVYEIQGHLHRAAEVYQQVLCQTTGPGKLPLPMAGQAHIGLGKMLREWNELELAIEHIQRGIECGKQTSIQWIVLDGTFTLALACQGRGDAEGAYQAIQEAKRLVLAWNLPEADRIVETFELRFRLGRANSATDSEQALADTVRWAQERGLNAADAPDVMSEDLYLTLVRVHLARSSVEASRMYLQDAMASLKRRLLEAERGGRMARVIEILILQALVYAAQQETEQALRALKRTLSLAEPEGFIRLFVDEGEAMQQLLRQAAARGIAVDYVLKLLAAFDASAAEAESSALSQGGNTALIEPLSARELEVLHLIDAGHTNQQIANELIIAVSTVKRHINNIYGKLHAQNRTHALARARELKLL